MSRGRMALALGVALIVGGGLAIGLPGPIRPVAWSPPPGVALEGPLEVDRELRRVERIGEGELPGPEDVAIDGAGRLYCGVADGTIRRLTSLRDAPAPKWLAPRGPEERPRKLGGPRRGPKRVAPRGGAPRGGGFGGGEDLVDVRSGWHLEGFAETGGRPLGLDLGPDGTLWVADTELGLLSIDPAGGVERRVAEVGGRALRFANDVDAGPDGAIYFTDASRFDPDRIHLDTLEARPHGRLLRYTPADGGVDVLLDDLYFANGVAVAGDGSFVLVSESFRYRVRRLWLAGGRAGESEVLVDRLPGFPDGISADGRGGFWLALFTVRSAALDRLVHPRAWLKRLVARLPATLLSGPEPYGLVVAVDGAGRITGTLHDPGGERFANVTSVEEHAGHLYLGTTEGDAIGRYRLR